MRGQGVASTVQRVKALIEEAIVSSTVTVEDMTGAGDHLSAVVIAAAFEGKSRVEQHQMVYAPLRALMADQTVHALALKTYTPQAWAARAS